MSNDGGWTCQPVSNWEIPPKILSINKTFVSHPKGMRMPIIKTKYFIFTNDCFEIINQIREIPKAQTPKTKYAGEKVIRKANNSIRTIVRKNNILFESVSK